MNFNQLRCSALLILACSWLSITKVQADIVSPTRLEIREVKPGVFEVFFVQPVIQGKVLKAQPVLPPICDWITDPQVSGDYNRKISKWQVACPVDSLYGKRFGIEGLLGSQVDILFSLHLLNGRSYQKMLSPINAFFVVPDPPGMIQISGSALISGLKGALQHFALYLLVIVMVLTAAYRPIPNKAMLFLATVGYAAGQLLTASQLLMLPENVPDLTTLITALLLSLQLLYKSFPKSIIYGWLPLFLGLAFGSVNYQPDDLAGYNQAELMTSSVILFVGFGIGLVMTYWLAENLIYTIQYLTKKKDQAVLAYFTGTLSFALLLYQLTPYLFTSGPGWNIPVLPICYVLMLSLWISYARLNQNATTGFLLIFLLSGVLLGATGIQLDWAVSLVLMVLFGIAVYISFQIIPAKWFIFLFVAFGTTMCGYYLSEMAHESLSYATAQTTGFLVILLLIWILGQEITPRLTTILEQAPLVRSTAMILVVALVGFTWFAAFSKTHLTQILANYTTGMLLIPVISLLLLVLAIWFWPRYRSIHRDMGLARRPPISSVLLIGAALFLLPWFTLKAKNPFKSDQKPDLRQVEGIIQGVLSNTYQAFNLEDEDRLFEQLSLSVDQQLIEDLYLDSRRKLRAGVRQGAEVTVREVELLEISNWNNSAAANSWSLDTKWVVTARVKHLQHIHHRRNQYTGTLVLKTENSRWKISDIVLTSEDREVIPSTNG